MASSVVIGQSKSMPSTHVKTVIDLCICSYKRPQLLDILKAISRQTGIEPQQLQIIVADNTEDAEMRDRTLRASQDLNINLCYIHAPANNISVARNACLDSASSPWIAFLDDDEMPTPNWLGFLLAEAKRGNWDAVLGPVNAIYPRDTPTWIAQGDFHSTKPVWVRGDIRTAYTGNVLVRRELIQSLNLRFRVELGKTGGEDEDFFHSFVEGGGRIGYAGEAVVYEQISSGRANFRWLLRRNFRAGQSHGLYLKRKGNRHADIVVAGAKALFCCAGSVIWLSHTVRRNRFLTRAALHFGVVSSLLNFQQLELY